MHRMVVRNHGSGPEARREPGRIESSSSFKMREPFHDPDEQCDKRDHHIQDSQHDCGAAAIISTCVSPNYPKHYSQNQPGADHKNAVGVHLIFIAGPVLQGNKNRAITTRRHAMVTLIVETRMETVLINSWVMFNIKRRSPRFAARASNSIGTQLTVPSCPCSCGTRGPSWPSRAGRRPSGQPCRGGYEHRRNWSDELR